MLALKIISSFALVTSLANTYMIKILMDIEFKKDKWDDFKKKVKENK